MSYARDLKASILGNELHTEEIVAELAGMFRMNGTIRFEADLKMRVQFATTQNPLARRIFRAVKMQYGYEPRVGMKTSGLEYGKVYLVTIDESAIAERFLEEIGFRITGFLPEDTLDRKIYENHRAAFLRGAFLGAGSITDPKKSYHLEFFTSDPGFARLLQRLLGEMIGKVHLTKRGEYIVIYTREAEKISDFLALVGAHKELLDFENMRVVREMRANVNRTVNCETANLNKSVEAFMRVERAIRHLEEKGVALDGDLRRVADARLTNREASLTTLAEELGLTKSSLRRRLAKIESLAEENGLRL